MLDIIAKTLGGIIKDTTVGITKVATTVASEVGSVPNAFKSGFSTGIITKSEPLDHHVDVVEETIAEKHGAPRFGSKAVA